MRAKLSTLKRRENLAKTRAALKNPSKKVIKKYKRFMRIAVNSSKEHKQRGRPRSAKMGMVQPKNGHRTTESPEKKFSPRIPTQSAPSVVTRHQLQFGGGDPDAGIFPAFFTPPIRLRKQQRRQNSVGGVGPSARILKTPLGPLASGKNGESARGKMQGIGGEMMKQSTSKRLFKNPLMPTQSTPSVMTRRHQMQQQNGSKNAQQSFKSISRKGRRRRTANCPPRFSPSPRRKGSRNRGLGVAKMEIDEFGEESEEQEDMEEEEEEDPVSEIDLLCGSNSTNPEPNNGGDKIVDGQSEELSQKDRKMMARCAFAQVEVAIDNGQLDRTVRQILRTRSEEMVPDARPPSSILFQPSPCFSLASCRPDFERISTQIGVELREECESLVFLCLDSPVPGLAGSLLCFSESVDADAICVDEFRHLELAGTFEWLKAGKQQFLDAVFGRCIQFFGIGLSGDFKG